MAGGDRSAELGALLFTELVRWSERDVSRGRVWRMLEEVLSDETTLIHFWRQAGAKLVLSAHDGQTHSFSFPIVDRLPGLVFFAMALTDRSDLDAEVLLDRAFTKAVLSNAAMLAGAQRLRFGGLLLFQAAISVKAGEASVSCACAWRPWPDHSDELPEEWRETLMPWREREKQAPPQAPAPLPSLGPEEIRTLAAATIALERALDQLWALNPSDRPPYFDSWHEAREAASELAKPFNAAAERCRIPNRVSEYRYDQLYSAAVILETLRVDAIATSVAAELRRGHGADAAARYQADLRSLRAPRKVDDRLRTRPPAPTVAAAVTPGELAGGAPVFLCYSWADKHNRVRIVYEDLIAAGVRTWFDESEQPENAVLDRRIEAALLEAHLVIVCVSAEMLTRCGYALREVVYLRSRLPAASARRRLLIARLDDLPLPPGLDDLQAVPIEDAVGRAREMLEASPISSEPLEPPLDGAWARALIGGAPASQTTPMGVRSIAALERQLRLLRAVADVTTAMAERDLPKAAADCSSLIAGLRGQEAALEPIERAWLLRARAAALRAYVNIGIHAKDETGAGLLAAAWEALDAIAALQPLDPREPTAGALSPEAVLLSLQDQREAAQFALREWFNGWSPETIGRFSGGRVRPRPGEMEGRLSRLLVVTGEHLLALRLLVDRRELSLREIPSANAIAAAIEAQLRDRLRRVEANVLASGGIDELRALLDAAVPALAMGLTEKAIEVLAGKPATTTEVPIERDGLRLRVRLRSFEGTFADDGPRAGRHVLDDLGFRAVSPSPASHLSVALIAAVHYAPDLDAWSTEIQLATLPVRGPEAEALPPLLRLALLPAELLSEAEIAAVSEAASSGVE